MAEISTKSLRTAAGVVALVAVLAACGGPSNSGRFEVEGVRKYESCLDRVFPFEPASFAVRKRIDSAGLLMQSKVSLTQDADLVYIELYRLEQLRRQGNASYSFDYPPTAASPVRAEIDVQESCPDQPVSLAAEGSIQLEEFGVEAGDRVVGTISGGRIVDTRTGETVASSFTGDWAYSVDVTSPNRSYPTYRDEYPTGP